MREDEKVRLGHAANNGLVFAWDDPPPTGHPGDDFGRGRLGLPPTGPQQLGIHTGEPYKVTDEWSGHFEGQIHIDPQKSIYR